MDPVVRLVEASQAKKQHKTMNICNRKDNNAMLLQIWRFGPAKAGHGRVSRENQGNLVNEVNQVNELHEGNEVKNRARHEQVNMSRNGSP